jgi:hypothetical protein
MYSLITPRVAARPEDAAGTLVARTRLRAQPLRSACCCVASLRPAALHCVARPHTRTTLTNSPPPCPSSRKSVNGPNIHLTSYGQRALRPAPCAQADHSICSRPSPAPGMHGPRRPRLELVSLTFSPRRSTHALVTSPRTPAWREAVAVPIGDTVRATARARDCRPDSLAACTQDTTRRHAHLLGTLFHTVLLTRPALRAADGSPAPCMEGRTSRQRRDCPACLDHPRHDTAAP